MKVERYLPTLLDPVLLVFLFLATNQIWEYDTWWHLRTGSAIWEGGSIPRVDPFSYTAQGTPWTVDGWLFELLLLGIHAMGGTALVVAVTGVTVTLAALHLHGTLREEGSSPTTATLVLALGFLTTYSFWTARPHLLGLVFFLWILRISSRLERGTSQRWWLLPSIVLLWANVHPSFAVGLAYLAVTALGNAWEGRPFLPHVAALGLSIPATLVTPHGFGLWRYFRGYGPSSAHLTRIGEWASPDFHQNMALLLFVMFCVTLMLLAPRRPTTTRCWLFLGLLGSLLISLRHVVFFAPVAALAVAPCLGSALERLGGWLRGLVPRVVGSLQRHEEMARGVRLQVVTVAGCLGVLVSGLFPSLRTPWLAERMSTSRHHFPVGAVDWLQKENPTGRIFAPYRWGGYLLFRLPDRQVFIDGRTNLYGSDLWRDYQAVMTPFRNWKEVLERWEVSTALMYRYSPATVNLEQAGWKVVYQDDLHQVLRRP